MKLTFLGATQEVTGSQTLVEIKNNLYLIDCGLCQDKKQSVQKNKRQFSFSPNELKAVFLTHSHIDHSGLLPKLVKEGFQGPIFVTPATYDLCEVLLTDSAELQELEVKKWNKKYPKSATSPLYNFKDVQQTLSQMKICPFDEKQSLKDIEFRFNYAGHILGAASLSFFTSSGNLFFSGDIGRQNDVLMYPPNIKLLQKESYQAIVIEGTYGDKNHPQDSVQNFMIDLLKEIIKKQSIVVIPSFAVARTQALLCLFYEIFEQQKDLKVPLIVSSPMAEKACQLYEKHSDQTKIDARKAKEIYSMPRYLRWKRESENINRRKGPMILISASGMLTGGRIVHHLKAFAEDSNNIILITGFQAQETPGREVIEGKKRIYIEGRKIDINAQVRVLENLSAHADQQDLFQYIRSFKNRPPVFLQHGEKEVLLNFQECLKKDSHLENVIIPREGEQWSVSNEKVILC